MYVWNHEAWYKCIRDDVSDEDIGIAAEFEVDVGDWGMQWPEGLIAPNKELELDK